MNSRLLQELEVRAREAKDWVSWSKAVCQMAIHRARQGQFEIAAGYIKSIRDHYGVELQHEVASWVMLAEGILHFARAEMTQAYERLRRAYGLAVALRTESVRPVSAAWMALIEFNSGKYDDMIAHIREVLNDAASDDHQARGRACLVLADAIQVSGSYELARPWYEQTRLHATAEGDQAMLSALLYNVAVFRTANLRLLDAFSEIKPEDLKRASLEANSSFTYDMAVGATSFTTLWRILHAQLLIIQSEFSEAKILLDSIRMEQLAPHDVPLFSCDLAWCHLKLGNSAEAETLSLRAEAERNNLTEPDDLAYLYSRLSNIQKLLGRSDQAEELKCLSIEFLNDHRVFQSSLLEKIKSLPMINLQHKK